MENLSFKTEKFREQDTDSSNDTSVTLVRETVSITSCDDNVQQQINCSGKGEMEVRVVASDFG